jgi:hypothetical protein
MELKFHNGAVAIKRADLMMGSKDKQIKNLA